MSLLPHAAAETSASSKHVSITSSCVEQAGRTQLARRKNRASRIAFLSKFSFKLANLYLSCYEILQERQGCSISLHVCNVPGTVGGAVYRYFAPHRHQPWNNQTACLGAHPPVYFHVTMHTASQACWQVGAHQSALSPIAVSVTRKTSFGTDESRPTFSVQTMQVLYARAATFTRRARPTALAGTVTSELDTGGPCQLLVTERLCYTARCLTKRGYVIYVRV